MGAAYNTSGLQSLLGYGRIAHERSGGICQLCGCGAGPEIDFDMWRQLTIEHLIGQAQGGYPPRIRAAVDVRFAHLDESERRELANRIHEMNIVTACQFCNSATSRGVAPFTMEEVIASLPADPHEAIAATEIKLQPILEEKRSRVEWKLQSVRMVFQDVIRPELLRRREDDATLRERCQRSLD